MRSELTILISSLRGDTMTKIVVFGAGKIAEVFHASVLADPALSLVGFTCDRGFMPGHEFHGLPLVPFEEVEIVFPPSDFAMFVAIGYHELNSIRADRCAQAREKGFHLVSWVSPRAHVSSTCTVGANCCIMDGASLQPYARLGDDVFVWNGAVVGHHAVIGDHCWLASNCTVSSTAVVEPFCFLGVNAAIGHGITVGERSIIGAAAVLTRSTAPQGVYIVRDTERLRLDSQHFSKISRIV
jgi:sugar O-acyltransferase (sialic acid O-acetyltransferase NeuD family)